MEQMYIRELVAWVLVCGLVVILVSSKRKAKTKSSKSSPKKASTLDKVEIGEDIPFLEMTPDESEAVAQLEKDLDKEARAESRRVGSVPKKTSRTGSKRGRTDKVSGSPTRNEKVRGRKTTKPDGSSPHKGKKRTS